MPWTVAALASVTLSVAGVRNTCGVTVGPPTPRNLSAALMLIAARREQDRAHFLVLLDPVEVFFSRIRNATEVHVFGVVGEFYQPGNRMLRGSSGRGHPAFARQLGDRLDRLNDLRREPFS